MSMCYTVGLVLGIWYALMQGNLLAAILALIVFIFFYRLYTGSFE